MMGFGKSALAQAEDVLRRQRSALQAGDLTGLERIAADLSSAFERLKTRGGDPDDIARIRADAAHNARLVRAALSGVGQAQATLSAARAATLSTYDASGQSTPHGAPAGRTLARR